jgi:polysaccharide pyruvyl transferase WcaK-like protein
MVNKSSTKIAVFGHYGNQNLGDEAIIEAVIQNCRMRYPQAEIVCLSIDPQDSAKRHRVAAYPIRAGGRQWLAFPRYKDDGGKPAERGLKALIKHRLPYIFYLVKIAAWCLQLPLKIVEQIGFARKNYPLVKSLDYLLISGSNQFLDNFGGAWGFPYTLLFWTVLAKLAGTKVAFISVGAGPLDGRLGQKFVKSAIKLADYYSFRDVGSAELVSRFFPAVNKDIYPDLAFSLIKEFPHSETKSDGGYIPVVGINPMPVYDSRYWPIADPVKYRQYVQAIVEFSTWLIERNCEIRFFTTQPKDGNVIVDIQAQLENNFPQSNNKVSVVASETVSELLNHMQQLDLIIATRFHGVLLSLFLEKPVVAICYGQKTFDLMADCGLGEVACDLDSIGSEELCHCFQEIQSGSDQIHTRLSDRNRLYVKCLTEQYDRVFEQQK